MLSPRLLAAAVILLAPAALIVDAGAQPASERGPAAVGSHERPVTVAPRVRQRGTLTMHPQLSQPGTLPASSASAKSSMAATFRPIRSGRKVLLQRRQGRRWVSVATARQNAAGVVEFNAPYRFKNAFATYRAVTVRHRGLASKGTSPARTDRWGSPDFTDEFNSLDPAKWRNRVQNFGKPGDSRTCSRTGTDDTVSVSGGLLRLSVKPDHGPNLLPSKCSFDGQEYSWRANGHVSTEQTHSFLYGYAAARMKFQHHPGQHAAFWMQSAAPKPGATDVGPNIEIDIIEWFGKSASDRRSPLSSVVHVRGDSRSPYCGRIPRPDRFGSDWATKYHVFSVEWTPSRYTFRIDGRKTCTTTSGVSRRPEYLILSLLSSDWELPASQEKLPQHMYVDWVRFWDRQR